MKIQEAQQYPNILGKTFIDKKEYTHYRESLPKELRIIGRDNYNEFVRTYFSTIGECLSEYEGGVCVDKMMYLFMFRVPDKMSYKIFGKRKFNLHSNNYIYAVSGYFGNRYSHWVVRKKSLVKEFRQKIANNLRGGLKHKAYFNTLKNMRKI